jgi:hypothetical protein
MRMLLSSTLALSMTLACSASEPAASLPGEARTMSPLEAVKAGSPASALLEGGTYWFVFDESPTVLAMMQDRCSHKSDSARCVDEVRQAGAHEGIRFSGADPSNVTWTSFGVEDGREVLFLEMPLAVTDTDGPVVHTKLAGPPRGRQAAGFDRKAPSGGPSFEVIDAKTVAMTDPDKGKLVFRAR